MRKSQSAGIALLFLFIALASLRDTFLSRLFASLGPFQFAFIAFGTAIVFFLTIVLVRAPRDLLGLGRVWREVIAVNITSAVAWLSYLGALKRIEPSVVNTIFAGVAPLAVTFLAMIGLRTKSFASSRPLEHVAHWGLAIALALMIWVVLSGHAAPIRSSVSNAVLGLSLAIISGTVITAETVFAKRMNEAGISAGAVVAVRFFLIVLIAGIYVAYSGTGFADRGPSSLVSLIAAALLLIVAPIYLVQQGLAWTSPMTTSLILALQPVVVFLTQLTIGYQPPSSFVFGVIGLYAVFAVAAVLLPLHAVSPRRLAASVRP
jgi:drug/metabolite transporter (DMT)-like permease